MIITHNGKQSFKIQAGDTTLAFNPVSKSSKSNIKPVKFGANAVFITVNHPDYNGVEMVTYGDKEPLVVDGPGDYEVFGNFVKGIMTETTIGKDTYINTIYTLQFDGIDICFLGDLGSKDIPASVREAVEGVDIIFVSLGGALTPGQAHTVANSFNPNIIIPMDYDTKTLQQFLKEGGDEKTKPEEKLTIKAKDLMGREADIIVLKA